MSSTSKPNNTLSHSATVFPVSNMEASLPFYRDKLGFEVTFEWNDPVDYAVLRRDGVNIHLTLSDDTVVPNSHRALYIFPYDVDAVYNEFKDRNTEGLSDIGDREYGMRDFDVTDPDGHVLCFGKGKEE